MSKPPTCAPPPEHRDKPWHWLRYKNHPCEPAHWQAGKLVWVLIGDSGQSDPDQIYRSGWRYVAPCVPPPASEGEG